MKYLFEQFEEMFDGMLEIMRVKRLVKFSLKEKPTTSFFGLLFLVLCVNGCLGCKLKGILYYV